MILQLTCFQGCIASPAELDLPGSCSFPALTRPSNQLSNLHGICPRHASLQSEARCTKTSGSHLEDFCLYPLESRACWAQVQLSEQACCLQTLFLGEGKPEDYQVSSLLADDFKYNQYRGGEQTRRSNTAWREADNQTA